MGHCTYVQPSCSCKSLAAWLAYVSPKYHPESQTFSYGKVDILLFGHWPPGAGCRACFKGVSTEFMLSEDFTQAYTALQHQWFVEYGVIRQGTASLSLIIICSWFVEDIHHYTDDLSMYRTFRKQFAVYLGNWIQLARVKVTVDQDH
jgi:hypothetical protein